MCKKKVTVGCIYIRMNAANKNICVNTIRVPYFISHHHLKIVFKLPQLHCNVTVSQWHEVLITYYGGFLYLLLRKWSHFFRVLCQTLTKFGWSGQKSGMSELKLIWPVILTDDQSAVILRLVKPWLHVINVFRFLWYTHLSGVFWERRNWRFTVLEIKMYAVDRNRQTWRVM